MAGACKDVAEATEYLSEETIEQAEILMKYEGYLEREQENAEKLKRLEDLKINPDFDYASIVSLGTEAKEKLKKFKPSSIGQASRISGINPADISVLLVHMGR
jgi:tRNA uridine 5-carboxymethylaminomethyl modification enzyme